MASGAFAGSEMSSVRSPRSWPYVEFGLRLSVAGALAIVTGAAAFTPPDAHAEAQPVIRIRQPVSGTTVRAHPALVRGTIDPPATNVRITVNGWPVFLIQNGDWATLIDLPVGTHTLTADLRVAGRLLSRAETTVTVAGRVPEPGEWPLLFTGGANWPLDIGRDVPIGMPPFEWRFRLAPNTVAEGELDPEGTGQIVQTLSGAGYVHAFRTPGLYTPTFRYTDKSGGMTTQQALVVVFDPAWLEPILQALWDEFQAAVARNDHQAVLALTHSARRRLLRLLLEVFGPLDLRTLGVPTGPVKLTLERVAYGLAWCRAQERPNSDYIRFAIDPSVGQWRFH